MKNPPFSVAMCVYWKDDPEWLKQAVNSITDQTVMPSEIVLVVDGEVSEALDSVINRCEQLPLFRVVRLSENQGHGNARRVGLQHCVNELVALMDADDVSVPDRFEKQLVFFAQHEHISLVGGQVAEFLQDPKSPSSTRNVSETDAQIKRDMRKRCPINQPTVMFKKQDVEAAGGFLDWYCNEDYFLWLRMSLMNQQFANVPDVLVSMRISPDTYQRRGGWKYFKSEAKLQKYMLDHAIVDPIMYLFNIGKRFIVQILIPNKARGWVYRRFARGSSS